MGKIKTNVIVNGNSYEAEIYGKKRDGEWENRESKSLKMKMSFEDAMNDFSDNVPWSILYQGPDYFDPETQKTVTPPVEEYDNSDFSILGDIIVHRDGTVTVKMGKPTAEELYNILKEAVEGESATEN